MRQTRGIHCKLTLVVFYHRRSDVGCRCPIEIECRHANGGDWGTTTGASAEVENGDDDDDNNNVDASQCDEKRWNFIFYQYLLTTN